MNPCEQIPKMMFLLRNIIVVFHIFIDADVDIYVEIILYETDSIL